MKLRDVIQRINLVVLVLLLVIVLPTASATAQNILRGWGYSAQPPANPQLGDGWLPANHTNLRYWNGTHWEPVGGKWYKIGTYTNDDFPPEGVVLQVEPGMPQALGFETWQAMADDIASPDGVISEIGLQYVEHVDTGKTNWFESFPANGLAPEGWPYFDSDERWMYLSRDRTRGAGKNVVYLRLQGTQDAHHRRREGGPTSPVLRPQIGYDGAWDKTYTVYVKI